MMPRVVQWFLVNRGAAGSRETEFCLCLLLGSVALAVLMGRREGESDNSRETHICGKKVNKNTQIKKVQLRKGKSIPFPGKQQKNLRVTYRKLREFTLNAVFVIISIQLLQV